MIASLPKSPAWKEQVVEVEGGSTKKPIKFRFRHGVEVFRYIYGNPTFADDLENAPYVLWDDGDQLYNEANSGTRAWEVQVSTGSPIL